MPSKPETTNKANTNEEKTEIENVPSVNWRMEMKIHSAVTVTARVLLAETLETHSQMKKNAEG